MKLDPIRALRIIEGLTLEPSIDNKLCAEIYRIAHQAGSPDCAERNHSSWTDLAIETEEQLVKDRIIPPWSE